VANIYRIHPAIGIARLGDSPDKYFVGPEAPGVLPSLDQPGAPHDPDARYKDDQGRIKRQGARFRIYEHTLDDTGATTRVQEITATDAQIEWEVHLANRKAAAPKFFSPSRGDTRNEKTHDKSQLIIDAGPQKVGGVEQRMKHLQGRFLDAVDVPLGDLLTDSAGRLILLGGFGRSQSPSGRPLVGFADNDGWCDDTSDGPVRATIRLNGSTETIDADPAWVIIAPPDFAPPIENVVTLYDVVYSMTAKFVDTSLAVGNDTKVSFTKDVYPIFRRVSNLHWVSDTAAIGHGEGSFGHFISRVPELASGQPEKAPLRNMIFRRLRNPKGGGGNMPKLPNDADPDPDPNNTISLTQVQYERLKRWTQGEFEADWPRDGEPAPLPLDELPETEKPQALDRAALDACVGGGFFPGIEVGRIMLEESTYDKDRPFRISAELGPGTLTARMAVPWQADFHDCSIEDGMDWWPGQRPNQVFRGQQRDDWMPPGWKRLDMVKGWSKLGFVVNATTPDGVRYVEDERSPDIL
jgi:hypothetical protein